MRRESEKPEKQSLLGGKKRRNWTYSWQCGVSTALVVALLIILVLCIVVIILVTAVIVEAEGHAGVKFEKAHNEVGGNVSVKLSSDFDVHKVDKVELNLTNITKSGHPAIVHYGSCIDIKNKTVAVSQRFTVNITDVSLKPQPINYMNDTPIYALAGSSLSYKIQAQASTDIYSSGPGCVSLFLFNTYASYQMFLIDKDGGQYFNESVCLQPNRTDLFTAAIHTINLNEDTFLFAAITTNTTASLVTAVMSVNVTINGSLREYDVSLLNNKTVRNGDYSLDLCESVFGCNYGFSGRTKCVFIQSPVLANISFLPADCPQSDDVEKHRISSRHTSIDLGIILSFTAIIIVVLIIAVVCSIYICCRNCRNFNKAERQRAGSTQSNSTDSSCSGMHSFSSDKKKQKADDVLRTHQCDIINVIASAGLHKIIRQCEAKHLITTDIRSTLVSKSTGLTEDDRAYQLLDSIRRSLNVNTDEVLNKFLCILYHTGGSSGETVSEDIALDYSKSGYRLKNFKVTGVSCIDSPSPSS